MTSKAKESVRDRVVDGIVSMDLYQQCPNTVVFITVEYEGILYHTCGFAKVNWPDKWDADYGLRIALGKAVGNAVRTIMSGKRSYASITPHPGDFARAVLIGVGSEPDGHHGGNEDT